MLVISRRTRLFLGIQTNTIWIKIANLESLSDVLVALLVLTALTALIVFVALIAFVVVVIVAVVAVVIAAVVAVVIVAVDVAGGVAAVDNSIFEGKRGYQWRKALHDCVGFSL